MLAKVPAFSRPRLSVTLGLSFDLSPVIACLVVNCLFVKL